MLLARHRTVGALALALAFSLGLPSAAQASVSATPDVTDRAFGEILALAHAGDTTYIGGEFTAAGGKTRYNVAAIGPDGVVKTNFKPVVNGPVLALAVSEDGSTVFVGGTFTSAGGAERINLAALAASTGAALPGWRADASGAYPDVLSLDVSGDRLYVAGRFVGIDGILRKRLAAVDVTSGNVVPSFNPAADAGIREVVVSPDGSKVYAGGTFTSIGGQTRLNHVAELSAATGAATSFNPPVGGGNIITIEIAADGSRFFFGTENNTVFAYDPSLGGAQPVWTRKMSGDTQAMAASPSGELYIGGHFSQDIATKAKRPYFASIMIGNGSLTSWAPQATGGQLGVWALLVEGNHVHAGGVFESFNGVLQRAYARFSGTP